MSRSPLKTRSRPIKTAKNQKRWFGLGLMAAVMVFSLFLQGTQAEWFSSDLKVWVLDVGQGDAIFIQTPEGEQILVDSGNPGTVLAKLGQVMPPWDRTIDKVIVTHPHADHEGGLPEILRRYQVTTIYETGVLGYDDMQYQVTELAAEQGTEIILSSNGVLPSSSPRWGRVGLHPPKSGEGGESAQLELRIIAPDSNLHNKKIDNLNSASIVLLLTYGDTSILLTGDATNEEESDFLSDLSEPIDILKVAHHGSVTSTSQKFLEIAAPRFAIFSVGADNDYGHPHPVTLERLYSRDIEIFRTDLDGDVLITSDGGEPVVESRPLPF